MKRRNIFKTIFAALLASRVNGSAAPDVIPDYIPAPLPYKPFDISCSDGVMNVHLPTIREGERFEFYCERAMRFVDLERIGELSVNSGDFFAATRYDGSLRYTVIPFSNQTPPWET